MSKQRLYIFVGYPGAGKTTIAKIIAKDTGAVHLWADQERLKIFGHPTHSEAESTQLYAELNTRTDELLAQGKSVIFDTNFNHVHDRQLLRDIAAKYGAETVLIWVKTPFEVAKQRAVHDSNLRNGYMAIMTEEHFTSIATKLEFPTADEHPIIVDGTVDNAASVRQQLGL